MNLPEIFKDKSIKPKDRTEKLSAWISSDSANVDELLEFAKSSKDPVKASCIEVVEYATKTKPQVCSADFFDFASESLAENPRSKREAAGLHRFIQTP
ncbi:MAG: hypothetical protein IPO32_13960 [Crocinitomicaceae bacterium]|nr:hypothetical protein [Crocinitomicaceae bacterium]